MTIDLSQIPHEKRKRLIALGKRFGSQDTLNQANQSLAACASHGAELLPFGVGPKHIQELKDLRDALVSAGVGREEAKGLKKVNSMAYVDAMNKAQSARLRCQSVLRCAADELDHSSDAAQTEGAKTALSALAQSRKAPDEAEPLATQLSVLMGALKHSAVATALLELGGPAAVADAETAIAALRKADEDASGARGTPAETQTLDLLDGMIVQLTRRMRRAAAAAAKAKGDAALISLFKLDQLYGHRAAAPPEEEEDDDAAGEDTSPDQP